jgi:hypothetical protein
LRYDTLSVRRSRLLCTVPALVLLLLTPVAATQAKGKAQAKAKPAPASRKPAAQRPQLQRPQPKEQALPRPEGKVVVFPFEGDTRAAAAVQRQVIATLKAKGLKVTTGLRPVDSAEQYREMSFTLGFVAFVDGDVSVDVEQGSATIFVRSGVTGLRVASTTFAGERRTLSSDVGKGLWERVVDPLAQVCVDAAKPRKAERQPLRIEAGTPIENTPPDAAGRM